MSDSARQFRVAAALVGFAIPVVACNGAIGDHASPTGTGGAGTVVGPGVLGGKSPEEVLASCAAPSPGRSPLRRLSNTEYRNTISDLFANVPAVVALVPAATSGFPSEPESLGFRNSGDYLTVPSLAAQTYLDAAEQIAETAANASNFVTCANGTQDAACATSFINSFGKQVYRRPLAADDTARYQALYQKAISSGYDFKTGIEWIVFAMLQSQQFLYRFELGATPTGNYAKPTQYEIASRLSFIYLQSMPDAALFAAADKGELATPAQIEAQARRLLADPKGGRLLDYFEQWLDIDTLPDIVRDGTVYPNLDSTLPALLAGRDARVRRRSAHVADGHLRGAVHRAVHVRQRGARPALRPHGADRVDVREGRRPGARGRADAGDAARARQGHQDLGRAARPQDPDRRAVPDRSGAAARRRPVQPRQDRHGRLAARAARATPHAWRRAPAATPSWIRSASSSKASMPWAAPARWTRWACRSCSRASCRGRATPTARWRARRSSGRSWRRASRSASCYVTNNFRFFYGREVEQADACSLARLLVDFKTANYNLTELLVALTRTDAFLYRGVTP